MATATYQDRFQNAWRERNRGESARAQHLARSLGWFSIGLGLAEILVPRRLGRIIGVRGHHGLMRTMGVREVAAGIAVLSNKAPARSMAARVSGDALDLGLLAAGLGSRGARRSRIAGAVAAVAGVTALDLACTKKLAEAEPPTSLQTIQTIAINRSPEECYQFWRDLENLPRFMKHLESVRVTPEGHTHWVAKGPAGTRVEWDAAITEESPDHIMWHSLEGSDVENSGSVRFERAPTGHGTIVRAHIQYRPPAGKIGSAVAKLFGEEPSIQAKTDLRRFKQLMETGEVATTEGQSSGRATAVVPVLRSSAAHA